MSAGPLDAVPPRGTVRLLGDLPLFTRVGAAEVAALAARARVRGLARGEVLFHRGEVAPGFFVVVEGVVKLAVQEVGGGEKVLEVIRPGETFGEAVMLLGEPYPVTATALEPTRLVTVPIDAVEHLLASDPMFARRMLAGMAVRLHTMVRDVASYTLSSSRDRVVAYLVAAARQEPPRDRVGQQRSRADRPAPGDDDRVVVLPTSKQVIASRLNLTPETFSRALRDLSDRGLIRVAGRQIFVPDLEALAEQGPTSSPGGGFPRGRP
ncbi:MAG TPA: Crp/Fnr family transcriptional regulator [Kineosporiaceae bacterium]